MADTPLSKPTSDKIPPQQNTSRQERPEIDKRPFIAADITLVIAAIAMAVSGGGPLDPMQFFWVSACVIVGGTLLVLPWLFELRLRSEVRDAERDQLNWETVQQLSSAIFTQQKQAEAFHEQAEKCADTIGQQDREAKELSAQMVEIKTQLDRIGRFDKPVEGMKSMLDELKPVIEAIRKIQGENTEKLAILEKRTESKTSELESLSSQLNEQKDLVLELKESLHALSGKLENVNKGSSLDKEPLAATPEPKQDEPIKQSQVTSKPNEPGDNSPKPPKTLAKEASLPSVSDLVETPSASKDKEYGNDSETGPITGAEPIEPETPKEAFSPRQPDTRPSMMEKAMGAVRAGQQSPAISRLITPNKPGPKKEPEPGKIESAAPLPKPADIPFQAEGKPKTEASSPSASETPDPAEKPQVSKPEANPVAPAPAPRSDEVPQLELSDDDHSAPALLKAVSASAKSKPTLTDKDAVLTLHALVGIGNKPYLRKQGSEQGQPMEFVEIGKWRYILRDVDESTQYEVLLNDETPSDAGSITLAPGETREITARF